MKLLYYALVWSNCGVCCRLQRATSGTRRASSGRRRTDRPDRDTSAGSTGQCVVELVSMGQHVLHLISTSQRVLKIVQVIL